MNVPAADALDAFADMIGKAPLKTDAATLQQLAIELGAARRDAVPKLVELIYRDVADSARKAARELRERG